MATYVMSDIHGMCGPFMRRIKQLDNLKSVKSGEDKLILLGDYVDVGMNSYKVLQTIYDLKKIDEMLEYYAKKGCDVKTLGEFVAEG